MTLHRQRGPADHCALCPSGCRSSCQPGSPTPSSSLPCIQMAPNTDPPPPDSRDHSIPSFFYTPQVSLNDLRGWRWGVTPAHRWVWPCNPRRMQELRAHQPRPACLTSSLGGKGTRSFSDWPVWAGGRLKLKTETGLAPSAGPKGPGILSAPTAEPSRGAGPVHHHPGPFSQGKVHTLTHGPFL